MKKKKNSPTKKQIKILSELIEELKKTRMFGEYHSNCSCVRITPFVLREGKRCGDKTFTDKPAERIYDLLRELVGRKEPDTYNEFDKITYHDDITY